VIETQCSVVKYYLMLSRDKSEEELSVDYKKYIFVNFALWNLMKEKIWKSPSQK
jgi:hypothetical protein